jgi:thymidylate synthase
MNQIDRQYKELLEYILHFGVEKADRTGTGTKSIFGWQIRHNMKEGFPLLTTKKMAWKTMATELLWFLRGDTNIKFLLDYDCNIWNGDAYKRYKSTNPDNLRNYEMFETVDELTKTYTYFTQEEFINKIKTNDEFAKKWAELGPIYGKQWRSWTKSWWEESELSIASGGVQGGTYYKPKQIDQIANLISELKTNPDSRRLMVSAWNVSDLDQMVLPPCHYGFQVYTRKLSLKERYSIAKYDWPPDGLHNVAINRLEQRNIPRRAISLMWNQRSVDTFLGLPFNIASYALLLEIIAKEVGMIPDELIGNLGDVHLYNNHIEQAKEQITRTPYELPKVRITEKNWYMHEAVKQHLGEKTFDDKILSYRPDCFELIDYQSHPKIKAPLSN